MEVLKAINERRSTRKFTKKMVEKEIVQELIDQAIMAPSARNSQPWAFFVIQDKEKLAEINKRTKQFMLSTIPVGAGQEGYRERMESEDYDVFYSGNTLLVICARKDSPNGEGDSHIAAQNVMLSAWDKGIGSCFMGFAKNYMCSPEGQTFLELPGGYEIVAPIILGYPESVPQAPERKPAEILFWDL